MKCSIVRELLPVYIEGAVSKETSEDMKNHMENCRECRKIYENMAAVLPRYTISAEDDKKLVKKLKSRLRRNNIIAAIIVCLVFALVLFAMHHEVPLPFDANRMFVERVQAAFVYDEEIGEFVATPVDQMNYQEMKEFQAGKYKAYNLAWNSYKGINNVGFMFRSRVIERNGTKVRVTYYSFFKTIWEIVFSNDIVGYSESGGFPANDYRVTNDNGGYEPVQTEMYYLPRTDLSPTDDLTDEEFDALKEKASLIWSDVT